MPPRSAPSGYNSHKLMILEALQCISNRGQSLPRAQAREVMAEVLAGNCTDAWIAAASHFRCVGTVDTLSERESIRYLA